MLYQFGEYQKSPILRGHLNLGGQNPDGERIDVTSLYFERGGRPWIGVMGEYHFVRDNAENWYDELCKMKAGGVTVVATYLFWIYHEEEEGVFDFSGDRDVRRFLGEVKRAGLDAVIRIGPWAHGECRNGGFPDWLMKKGYRLRTDDPAYLEKVRIWYTKLFEQFEGMFYKDGGHIIAVQLENELVNNASHLLTLKKIAKEIGYDVPLFTVTGWNSKYGAKIPVEEVVPVFAAYVEAPWANSIRPIPPSHNFTFDARRNDSSVGVDVIRDTDADGWRLPYELYPFATCELGSGLQPTHHRRILVSGQDAYALSLVKLGCGNNLVGYYMYHGGTNKIGKLSTLNETKATGYPNDYPVLNYDFHTALTQYGETREQYRLLNLLHLFVEEWGETLATMENVGATYIAPPADTDSLRYAMRTDGKSGFVFVNHYQKYMKLSDVRGAVIDTGTIRFPAIDVCGEVSFFMPFGLEMGAETLEYATAQPVCRDGDTWFFTAIDGITPTYKFVGSPAIDADLTTPMTFGDVKIVTLTFEKARYLRKLSGKVYLGEDGDVYEKDGEILSVADGSYAYLKWTDSGFERIEVKREFTPATLTAVPTDAPFDPPYPYDLSIGGERKLTWKKLSVDSLCGFVEIDDVCDASQIYADGQLVADNYYCGEPWRIPAKLIYDKECYLVTSELKDDCFRTF